MSKEVWIKLAENDEYFIVQMLMVIANNNFTPPKINTRVAKRVLDDEIKKQRKIQNKRS